MTLEIACKLARNRMLGSAEPNNTKSVIFGCKSSKSGKLDPAESSSLQIEKMTVKFNHRHVQRQTTHIIHCPIAVWDCKGRAQ